MRGFFGLVVCLAIGVLVTLRTKARPFDELRGLVFGTVSDALAHFKGAPGVERHTPWAAASLREEALGVDASGRARVRVSSQLAEDLGGLERGDILYVSDRRAWLGGLRSGHGAVAEIVDDQTKWLEAPSELCDAVGSDSARVRALY